ncbi:MAG: methionyl-tRNA formyltransferase, partial [Lachnospiraceae bacterium]|nr:methionyl-tRNA formyltransferase [Lachnospiraceae bacterium]
NPWPSAFTSLNGKTLKLWDADVTECNENVPAGSIVSVGKESFVVKCGEDALEVKELQLEGKKRMNCGDFLRGYNPEVGTVLGN